jgi:hypothetical protein
MADENVQPTESEEEAAERVRIVRATQIFGDTPTDPTIGDIDTPAHDEEAANLAGAEVAARAEDGDEEAAELTQEEAKRQNEPLSAEDVQEGADEESAEEAGVEGEATEEDSGPRSAAEKVEAIKAASSVEEVDELAADDDRVTVRNAADAKRSELSE